MIQSIIKLLFIVFLFGISAQVWCKDIYKISKMDSPDHQLIMVSVEKAYAALGIKVEFVEYPGRRALAESAKGDVDAELSRIVEVGKAYPTLIQVPTPIFWFDVTVFSKQKKFKPKAWSSLQNLRVGIMRGMIFAERGTQGFPSVLAVENPTSLFKMLDTNRIDVAVFSDLNGKFLIKKYGFKDIFALSPPLERIEAYHYVHQKHRDLVPKLDAEFKKMKNSGELETLRNNFMKSILADSDAWKTQRYFRF